MKNYIREYLKFILVFIFTFIRKNKLKTIFTILALICYNYAGTFKDDVEIHEIAATLKVDNNNIYIYRSLEENKIKYKAITASNDIIIKNGKIYKSSYAVTNVLLWVCFIIILAHICVFTFMTDDDLNWEFEDCWEKALSSLVYCEEENGEFYYFALGRLLDKRDTQIVRYNNATKALKFYSFGDIYRCPKFETKSKRREKNLKKLGI
jgi:hypothetical protein